MIDNSNFVQYAIRAYDNPQCRTIEQFNEDVNRFSMVKKLMKSDKYDEDFVNLTLNNIVALYNNFYHQDCTKMLFFKVREEHWYKLKTYLVFLGYMPEEIQELNLINSELPICQEIANHLRKI